MGYQYNPNRSSLSDVDFKTGIPSFIKKNKINIRIKIPTIAMPLIMVLAMRSRCFISLKSELPPLG